jgi:hypothetical protein
LLGAIHLCSAGFDRDGAMLFGVAIPTRLDQSLGTIAVYSARF